MADFVPGVYTSLAVLGASCALLAFRMSLYRGAQGSPGEDKPGSPMNRFSEVQLLHAEWAPAGAFLSVALLHKGVPRSTIDLWTFIFVAARLSFATGKLSRIEPLVLIGMLATYASTMGLAYHLAA